MGRSDIHDSWGLTSLFLFYNELIKNKNKLFLAICVQSLKLSR